MKKCNKKKMVAIMFFAVICCGLFISMVFASTYKSMLQLDSANLTGATRYFTAGTNNFSIKPTKLTPQEAGEYVQLKVMLTEDTGSMCVMIGTRYIDMYKAMLPNQTYTENFGYQSAGNRFYSFSTKHDNRDWGYVYAPQGNVIMSS